MVTRALNTLVRTPRNVSLLDGSQWAVTSAASTALVRILANKLRGRSWNDGLLRWAALGAGLGLGGYVLNRNIIEMMGGAAKDKSKLAKAINDGSTNHLFYVPGATEFRGLSDVNHSKVDGVHVVPFDELDAVADAIDRLPEDHKVTVVGHSAGGGGAYNLAGKVRRRIDKLITLDPVQTNLAKFVRDLVSGHKKPVNVVSWDNYSPRSLSAKTRSNAYVRYLLTRMDDYRLGADKNIRLPGDDHSMRTTGLRVDEWMKPELEKLKQKIYKEM